MLFIESYYSVTHDRQAKIYQDKYHYIVQRYQNDKSTITELFTINEENPEQAYIDATECAQKFIEGE